MKAIIIGGGIAAHEAAFTLRKEDPESQIIMLTDEKVPTYFRPRLIDYLAGRVEFEKIIIDKEDVYHDKNIHLLTECRVEKIDATEKTVTLSDARSFAYDKLLIATGAGSWMPPVNGAGLDGVFTFRDINDADAIIRYAENSNTAAVIGGGLLGLETAYSLVERGLKVYVIEIFDQLLPRQLDKKGAEMVRSLLEEKGLIFKLGVKTESFEGDEALNGVRLSTGETISADMAVVSAGVRTRLDLPRSAGVEIDKAVIVNDRMESSVDDIFAAGDSAQHNGRFYGLWLPARQQGQVAGQVIAGKDAAYQGTPLEARLKLTGITIFSAGDFHDEAGDVKTDMTNDVYRKAVIRDGILVGAIVIGDNKAAAAASRVIEGKKPLEAFVDW